MTRNPLDLEPSKTFRPLAPFEDRVGSFLTIDCGDSFYGKGFETGATLDVGGHKLKTYRVWLCVRVPKLRLMRLYAERIG